MPRRHAPLSQRQVDVLRWVADGCPDGVWRDFSYKQTAYALAGRDLIQVQRRRDAWRASVTEHGRYYLEHGTYAPAGNASPDPREAQPPRRLSGAVPLGPAPDVTPESLLADLASNEGTVTVPDPPGVSRGAYRSAMSRAVTEGLMPEGFGLRHSGRDRGDLVIRLVRLTNEPGRPEPLPSISVPADLRACHEAVAALQNAPQLLQVSDDARERALRITQAIATECDRRGYRFGLRGDDKPSFQVSLGQDAFAFTLSEESESREMADPEKLAEAKYAWQRVPLVIRKVPSGRLVLRLGEGYGSVSWADRQRWTLEQKLPAMFQLISDRASAQAQQRQHKEEERQRRRRAWEEAIPQAKQAYIEQLNRDRLHKQVARSAEAEAIRSYCSRLEATAAESGDPDLNEQIRAWAAWARQEADRIDPLNHPDLLAYRVPEDVGPSEFDKFMPRGLSAWRPPD